MAKMIQFGEEARRAMQAGVEIGRASCRERV